MSQREHHHRLPSLGRIASLAILGLVAACSGGAESLGGGGGGGEGGGGHGGGGGSGGMGGAGGSGGGTLRPGSSGSGLGQPIYFQAKNYHEGPRVETVRASVPFPEGQTSDLSNYGVKDMQAAWLPMQHWPDGSIRMAQVQFTDSFTGGESKTYEVVQNVTPLSGSFVENSWISSIGSGIRIAARVKDTFGVPYEAEITGAGEVLQETFLVRVKRHRLYHQATQSPNIGRDYLTSTFYVTEFQDMPFLVVDWILGNDYLGADETVGKTVATHPNYFPLGAIDVREASFMVQGHTEALGYLAGKHQIQAPVADPAGWSRYQVMANTAIADGSTRRYRFMIRVNDTNATVATQESWQNSFGAFVYNPLWTLATLQTWQNTEAMGLHGGPITGPSDALGRAQSDFSSWNNNNSWFGTWETFGDVKFSNTTGTPRNEPVSEELAHAAQSGYLRLLQPLEQMAWAQAVRPYHLYGLEVGTMQNLLLWEEVAYFPNGRALSPEKLGRFKVWNPDQYSGYRTMVNMGEVPPSSHGWNGFDHEHWTTDLLFDYWSVTADEWAKEELRQLGESLKGLMRIQGFTTAGMQAARAEGWCLTGFVHSYLATGDDTFKDYALLRVQNNVNPSIPNHVSNCFMMQNSHPLTGYPNPHKFYMPWQHGPVLFGFLAAHKFFESPLCLQIAETVPDAVEYAWITNWNDPTFGFVANGLRYYVPTQFNGTWIPANHYDNTAGIGVKFGCGPLGGAHSFLVSGLHILANRTSDATVQSKALFYANTILGQMNNNKRWYKWNLIVDEAFLTGGT